MKKRINKNKKIIIGTICLLVFLLIVRDIYKYEITAYDNFAYKTIVENTRSESMTIIMKIITTLGSGVVLIMLSLLSFFMFKDKKNIIYICTNLYFIYFLNNLIKLIVQRPRPSGYNIIEENSYSFPSGHSMISTAFYGLIIYLIYKNVKDTKKKYILISLLFLLIILIGISRIYLGVHYLSDVAGGFFIAIAYLMVYISTIQIINEYLEREIKWKD